MKTLYDVLGVSSHATDDQIEQGYKFSLDSLTRENSAKPEDDLIRAKAIKEAYAVLSSPARRQAYDQKLKGREQVTYQVVEKTEFPWVKISFAFFLIAGGIYYKVHSNKMEAERLALEAAKAQAAAEIAEKLAAAEQAAQEQQKLRDQRIAENRRQWEMEQARREGQQIHEQLQRADAQAAREKEQAERQVRYEQQREAQAAKIRSRNETAAMERALSIPIRRH